MFNFDSAFFRQLLLSLPWIILGLSFHEYCHAWMSDRFGDPLPRREGRLSLNPVKHIDPIGLLAIIIVRFGWAKPVRINPSYYKNPMRDTVWVSLAGPAGNFILAVIFTVVIRILRLGNFDIDFIGFFIYGLFYMLMLGFFNLIPVPPLDGSKILRYFLRGTVGYQFDRFEPYGMFLLLALLFFTGLPRLLSQLIDLAMTILTGIRFL